MDKRSIEPSVIKEKVSSLCLKANIELGDDVLFALNEAKEREEGIGKEVIEKIIENAMIAKEEKIPICQDTGMVIVFLRIGEDVLFNREMEEAIQEGVREGYKDLRASMLSDPIKGTNTEDNTPAFIYKSLKEGDGLEIFLFVKGAGSENQSRMHFFPPTTKMEEIEDFIVKESIEASYFSCPPCIIGVGIGGDQIKASFLAKEVLLDEVGKRNPDPFYAKMEQRILERINFLGPGPGALGGRTTALDVKINVSPTHIGSLPVAINVCCHAKRVASTRL